MTDRPPSAPGELQGEGRLASAGEQRESRRFGLEVRRFRSPRLDESDIELIANSACDVAVVRIDASALNRVQHLADRCCDVLVADTLVYYSLAFQNEPTRQTNTASCDVEIRRADASDFQQIAAVTRSAFVDYGNHYASNPLFSPNDILEGYVEWAETLLRSDAPFWIAVRGPSLVGYAAMVEYDDGVHDIALNAVRQDAQGQGVYGQLLDHAIEHSHREGARSFQSSTQAGNVRVQSAWASRGMRLSNVENTIHINLLRSDTQLLQRSKPFFVRPSDQAALHALALETVLELVPGGAQIERICEHFGPTEHTQHLLMSVELKKRWLDGRSLFRCEAADGSGRCTYQANVLVRGEFAEGTRA